MKLLSPEILRGVFKSCDASLWAPALAAAMDRWHIAGLARQSAFLAQVGHESAGFTRFTENLNYTAKRLVEVWPKRFTPALAEQYALKPEALANYIYGNRLGNGDEASGDGWVFRGRGPIQLTGKANYVQAATATGYDLVKHPDLVLGPKVGAEVAGWFWASHGCNELADAGDFAAITKAINGGLNGHTERVILWGKLKAALA